jgi:hypothetical protein
LCWSRSIGWSGRNSTLWSHHAEAISCTTVSSSGSRRSTPRTIAPIVVVTGSTSITL